MTLSADWVIIPFKKDAFAAALKNMASENPQLAAAAQAFQNLDPETFRLVAINRNPKYLKNTFASNLNVTAFADNLLANMPLEFVTGALEEQFKRNGAQALTNGVNMVENSHGADVEYINIEQTVKVSKIVQRALVFQANQKLIIIAFTILPPFSKDIFAEANSIAGTIELLK